MLLIQHDQAQLRHGREDCAAGPHHYRNLAPGDQLPLPVPLGIGQMAVQHGHPAEPQPEPLDGLRRQADLRHQHDRLPAVTHDLLDGLDVNLRLAAAGDAVYEDRAVALTPQGIDDGPQGLLLIGIEHEIALGGRGGLVGRPLRHATGAGRNQPPTPQDADGGQRCSGPTGPARRRDQRHREPASTRRTASCFSGRSPAASRWAPFAARLNIVTSRVPAWQPNPGGQHSFQYLTPRAQIVF